MSLQAVQPNQARRAFGRSLLASAVLAAMGAAFTAAASDEAASYGPRYNVDVRLQVDGHTVSPRIQVADGERFIFRTESRSRTWTAELVVTSASQPNEVQIGGRIDAGSKTIAQPKLIAQVGQPARVRVGTDAGPLDMSVTVTEAAR